MSKENTFPLPPEFGYKKTVLPGKQGSVVETSSVVVAPELPTLLSFVQATGAGFTMSIQQRFPGECPLPLGLLPQLMRLRRHSFTLNSGRPKNRTSANGPFSLSCS